jgi:hypothetical protein
MAKVSCSTSSGEFTKEVPSMRNIGVFGVSAFGQGPWKPGRKVWSIAFVGGSEIDFRQAQLDEGITNVTSIVIIGTSKIVVPTDMPVTLTGLSIMGIRSTKRSQAKDIPPLSAKGLRVSCFSLIGTFRLTDKP